MTVVHIDIIHGDHFIQQAEARPVRPSEIVSPVAVAKAAPDAQLVRLAWLVSRPVYIAKTQASELLFDARNGQRLPAPSRGEIRLLAEHWFTGPERLKRLDLITEIPGEIRGREPPLWRAEFDGCNKPTLYPSDFFWMLHIMDYTERASFNHPLIWMFGFAAVWLAITGLWLLFRTGWRRDLGLPRTSGR